MKSRVQNRFSPNNFSRAGVLLTGHRCVIKRVNVMKTFRLAPFFLLATLAWLPGCGQKMPPPKPPAAGHPLPSAAVAACEPGQSGGRLTLVTASEPRTFNPVLATDAASDSVIRLLFAGLIATDLLSGEPRPGLAESWSTTPDGRTWTFKLRPGLRWSDGEPLTADDVVFTWNEVMFNPDMNRMTYDFFRVDGKNFVVSKVDEVTVRVVTPVAFAPFLEFFGGVSILPKHSLGRDVAARQFLSSYSVKTRPDRIVGAGPFRLKEYSPGKFALLERNPEFWVADKTGRRLPYLDEVRIEFGGPGAAQRAFLDGHSDVCDHTRTEDFATFQAGLPSGKYQLIELGPGSERDFLWFNLNTNTVANGKPIVPPVKAKWFREKIFRQAVSCAIDRDRLVREAYGGRAIASLTFLGGENPKWNNPGVAKFGYDPARAKTLLAGIGIQDRNGDGKFEDAEGNVIEFTLLSNGGNPLREAAVKVVAEQLSQFGFKVTPQTVPYEMLIQRINGSFDYEGVLMGLGGGGMDPTAQSLVLKSSEQLHQWFPNQRAPATDWEARIDFLMDAQMRTMDFAARKKLYDEVQAILAEQMPMIYTVTPLHFAAARPGLGNLRPSVISPYHLTWNVEELFFKKP